MADTKFWANVNALLKNKDLTQDAMSSALGIPLQTIRGWVFKNILPRVDDGVRIASYLGTSVEYLLTGTDPVVTVYRIPEDLLEVMRKYAGS